MLTHLKMEFKGREHSGLDDARNLAAIGKRMYNDGCIFKTNCKYDSRKHVLYNTRKSTERKRR
jgi:3'-5' exoribonuclease 1